MSHPSIQTLKHWIIDEGLKAFTLEAVFETVCKSLAPEHHLYRVSLGMPTLHPLVEAKSIRWYRDTGLDFLVSEHGYSEGDDWRLSPINYMLENSLTKIRFRLDQEDNWQQFPILKDLAAAGCTEYYAQVVSFNDLDDSDMTEDYDGMVCAWATDHPDGLSTAFFSALDHILPPLALVSKLADRENTLLNILEAYFGSDAGLRVANGQIKRGELISIDAVIWYSDMRKSTHLADSLSSHEFLRTLNAYFECTAGSVLENQGEVLRFIGDAVLAIFPVENFSSPEQAAQAAWQAARSAQNKIERVNTERQSSGLEPLGFGLGLHAGILDYGNIGTPNRLEFSVIGPVANEVARLENLTKSLDCPVIVSETFSALLDLDWVYLGSQKLTGVNKSMKLYTA